MNSKDSSTFTMFRDRDLNAAPSRLNNPARFSTEPEGEGLEVFLRGLLVACLVAAMLIAGASLDSVTGNRHRSPNVADTHTAVACTQPVATPNAKAL